MILDKVRQDCEPSLACVRRWIFMKTCQSNYEMPLYHDEGSRMVSSEQCATFSLGFNIGFHKRLPLWWSKPLYLPVDLGQTKEHLRSANIARVLWIVSPSITGAHCIDFARILDWSVYQVAQIWIGKGKVLHHYLVALEDETFLRCAT